MEVIQRAVTHPMQIADDHHSRCARSQLAVRWGLLINCAADHSSLQHYRMLRSAPPVPCRQQPPRCASLDTAGGGLPRTSAGGLLCLQSMT